MKLNAVAISTLLALSPSLSFAAEQSVNSINEAFAQGTVNGEAKAYYWDRTRPFGDASMLTFGLNLGFKTASYNGLTLEAGFQNSASPEASDEAKAVFDFDQYGSGSQLSVLSAAYARGNSELKVGRMHLDNTLAATSYSRMVYEAFEAVQFTNTDIANTQIRAAFINKYQNRTDMEGGIGQFEKFNDDGAYTIDVTTEPLENLQLVAAYLDQLDVSRTAFAQATYQFNQFDFGAQYYGSELEGSDWNETLAAQAGVSFGKARVHMSYTTTGSGDGIQFGLGGGADRVYAGSLVWSPNYESDTDVYQIGSSYAFSPNLFALATYTLAEDLENEYSYLCGLVRYKFDGALQGLSATALTDIEGKDGEKKEVRFNLAYNF